MTPKELIKIMSNMPDQDEELIVAWWERSSVEGWMGRTITDDQWLFAEDDLMNGDWGDVDSQITYSIENYMEDFAQEQGVDK